MCAHKAYGMGIVHHDQSVIFIRQVTDGLQVGDIAVHGEHTVGSNKLDAAVFGLFQAALEILHIVILVAPALGFAQPYTIDNGGVIQFVRNNSVFFTKNGFKKTAIGIEAGGIEDGILHAYKAGNTAFQFLMDALRAADEADGGKTKAPFIIRSLGGVDQLLIVGKTQVIVGAHIHYTVGYGSVDAAFLRGHDDPLVLIGAGFLDGGQLLLIQCICFLHEWFLL